MRGSRKRLVLAAGAAALALGGAGAAQAAQARSYAIPPGTTAEALNAYARQSGRQLVFPYDAAAATHSAGVQGAVADDAALGQVLKGSRLTLASSDGKVVTLRAAAFRPATAQPAEPTPAAGPTAAAVSAPEPTVSEVVVTANKRAERAIDVANSVTAVSEEALERRNLTRIEEFAAQVPGLSIRSGLNGGTLLILRGLNTGGTGATVAATVDDAPLSYTSANGGGSIDTANIDTFDLERIEVLRGPQGTLYGSAAEGGLLKYVINKPKYDRFEGKLEVGGEGIDGGGVGGSVRGAVNIPLIDGRLALRASGFYYDTPGYIRNPLLGRSDLGEGERYGGRVALAFKASDTLSFRVTALRQKQTNDAQGAVEVLGSHATPAAPPANFLDIANGGVLTRNSRIVENSAREFNLYDGHIDWALPWFDVTSVTSYGEIETSYVLDNSNFALGGPATVASLFGARYGQPIVAQGQPNFSLHKFNQEVRFSSKPKSTVLGLPVELQAGFYYTKEDVNLASISNALSAANTSVVLTTPSPLGASLLTATYEEYSGFGEGNLHLTSKLTLTGGLRYSSNNQTAQPTTVGGLLTGPSIVRPTFVSSEDKLTWNAALRYALTDHASVYTRVASGYRPGGPVIPTPGAPADFPTSYGADNTVNYEIGLKGDFFDRRLSLDVAGFWIDWDDVQINSFFTSPSTGIRFSTTGNGGTAVSRGFEYSVAFSLFRGFQIGAVGSYTDAELTQDALAFGGLKGDRLPYVPKFTNTLNIDYSTVVHDDYRVFAGGSWQYESARFSDFGLSPAFSNHVRIPDYNTLNLQAGVEHGRYLAELYFRNINDERGITRYQGGNGANFTDLVGVITPRTIGGRITARF